MLSNIITALVGFFFGFLSRAFWERKSKEEKDKGYLIDIHGFLVKVIDWTYDTRTGHYESHMDELTQLSYRIQLKTNRDLSLKVRDFVKRNRSVKDFTGGVFRRIREETEELKSEIEDKIDTEKK